MSIEKRPQQFSGGLAVFCDGQNGYGWVCWLFREVGKVNTGRKSIFFRKTLIQSFILKEQPLLGNYRKPQCNCNSVLFVIEPESMRDLGFHLLTPLFCRRSSKHIVLYQLTGCSGGRQKLVRGTNDGDTKHPLCKIISYVAKITFTTEVGICSATFAGLRWPIAAERAGLKSL